MVVAANFAFAQIRENKIERFECDIPDGLEYNKPYTVEEIQEALDNESGDEIKFTGDVVEEKPKVHKAKHHVEDYKVSKEDKGKKLYGDDKKDSVNKKIMGSQSRPKRIG